jgi:hypothetical protein
MVGQRHVAADFSPGTSVGAHCVGGGVGLGACLDGSGKSLRHGFEPRTVESAASRYTGYAILATASM